jgi:hypothetical protein
MGANSIVAAATLLVPSTQHDTTDSSERLTHGFAYEHLSDLVGYNRVQGLSLGVGYRIPLPGIPRATAFATLRYGASDERVTWRFSIHRQQRVGSIRLSAYSDVHDVDPVSRGRSFNNTVNAVFAGHDNGDYVSSRGGSVSWETLAGRGLLLEVTTGIEKQLSLARTASSEVNDFLGGSGLFPPNPPVRQGTFGFASVGVGRRGRLAWNTTIDVRGGIGRTVARVMGSFRTTVGSGPAVTFNLRAGAATQPALPQSLFRLGGLGTVRGFEYGIRRAPAFWAAQADIVLSRGQVRPVVFLDAGQAARLSHLSSSPILAGAGVGVGLLKGLLRFELSRPIAPDIGGKVRFDVVIRG